MLDATPASGSLYGALIFTCDLVKIVSGESVSSRAASQAIDASASVGELVVARRADQVLAGLTRQY